MMTKISRKISCIFFVFTALFGAPLLRADTYEGIGLFESYSKIDIAWLTQFLPFNPIYLEAGAFRGSEVVRASKIWPEGRIIAFEPNPEAFSILRTATETLKNVETYPLALCNYNGIGTLNVCHGMNGSDPAFGYASSILPLKGEMKVYCKGPQAKVRCVILDDWCNANDLDHIDVLRLELEGLELPVLRSSPEILKKTKIIYVKTLIHPHRADMTGYNDLKAFLKESNFVLLSHRYTPGITGNAIFLSRELFDAYFKKSLGMYLEE